MEQANAHIKATQQEMGRTLYASLHPQRDHQDLYIRCTIALLKDSIDFQAEHFMIKDCYNNH